MKKDVVIFPDDPYEQKLIAAHDAIMEKCKKQEDEEKRKREESGDLTARSLIAPIQFYESDKEFAVVNAYNELCAKYKEGLAPDENPILVLSQGGVYYDNQNVAAASSNPYMSTQQYMTPYNGAGGSTHSFPAEKRHTAVPTATDLLGCLLKRVTLKRDGDAIYMFDGVCYNRLSDNAVNTLSMQHYDQQFANRILLLPFMHAVPPTHQDHMLLEKLKNEREGILAKAVRAFNQLESRNFVFSGDALYSFERQAVSSIPVEANAVKKFISACCELKEGFTPTSTLHNHYLSYCDANGFPPINDKVAFSKQLALTCGDAVARKKQRYGGESVNGYIGIVLKGGV